MADSPKVPAKAPTQTAPVTGKGATSKPPAMAPGSVGGKPTSAAMTDHIVTASVDYDHQQGPRQQAGGYVVEQQQQIPGNA